MRLNAYKLSKEKLSTIQELASRTTLYPAVGSRRRIGANGANALSVYNYDRWFGWSSVDRKTFKSVFPEEVIDRAIVGHFLEIPEGGFLDVMTAWVDTTQAGYMVSFNIGEEDATIIVSGKEVVVPVGGSVSFSLAEVHSIPKKSSGRDLWACVMLLEPPPSLKSEHKLVKKITA